MAEEIELNELGQEGKVSLNNRQEAMMKELNEKIGSNFPLTEGGYNEVGRSQGIIERLAVSTGEDPKEIEKRFLAISRSKKDKEK